MEDYGVQIVARHLITPSSPTPDHLKTLKLSFLDQLLPPMYVPLIFFYDQNPFCGTDDHHTKLCGSFMHSLSKALALFYPLAGKLDLHNFVINCDDSGVEFVEARVQAYLNDVLQNPTPDQLGMLLPVDLTGGIYIGKGTVFMVQVTSFGCGGFALAACMSHQVADIHSFVNFMNAWAAISRGYHTLDFEMEFGATACHFPTRDMSNCNRLAYHPMGNAKSMATKVFRFDKEKLSFLKNAAQSSMINNPTRVESVSAFIWKHFMDKKSNEQSGAPAKKTLSLVHVVNIRSRADPSLQLQKAFGNAILLAPSFASKGIWQMSELAARLRTGIRNVDSAYIKEMESRFLRDLAELNDKDAAITGEVEMHTFSSWCRFPVYDVDFGWERPAWVCTAALPFLMNVTILMSSKTGEEIEAWMNYPAEDLELFEREFNFIGTMNE